MQDAISSSWVGAQPPLISESGWRSAPFSRIDRRIGGPKWLILSELDHAGSRAAELRRSARHATGLIHRHLATRRLSQPDPAAAIQRLQHTYLYQEYASARPRRRRSVRSQS